MSPTEGSTTHFDVAIIGGGAAGTLVAIRLLADPQSRLRVAIVEPTADLARGAAYSTESADHLLNVIASRMSAFEEDPQHFVRYLVEQTTTNGRPVDRHAIATSFAPRRDYGRYLRATLQSQPRYPSLHHLCDRAVDLDEGNVVRLASGGEIRAKSVVLAVGNAPRHIPPTFFHGVARVADAWDYAVLRGIDPAADVCIIGSGLSMVDAVVTLAGKGYRGRILVLSRHGLMPLAHAAPGPRDDGINALATAPLRTKLRMLRRRAKDASAAGEPWQWVFDRLRPHPRAVDGRGRAAADVRFPKLVAVRHGLRLWPARRFPA